MNATGSFKCTILPATQHIHSPRCTYTHGGFVRLFVISRNPGLHEGGNVTGSHHNSARA